MKILLLNYEYPPIGGGGGVGSASYVQQWTDAGHTVYVITAGSTKDSKIENDENHSIRRVYRRRKDSEKVSSISFMLMYLVSSCMHLVVNYRELKKVDVINVHFVLPTGLLGRVARIVLKKPLVQTIIGGDVYDPTLKRSPHRHTLLRWIDRAIMKKADALVAISNDIKMRVETHYQLQKPIRVIGYQVLPPAIPSVERSDLSLSPDAYYLISIGRLIPRKGFDTIIKALPMLDDRVELLILGDGPMRNKLKQIAVERNVARRVHLLGVITGVKKYHYLHCSDCFVLASYHEGLGCVVQEAMYCGLPIITTDTGGQSDMLSPDKNALLFQAGNTNELAKKISSMYKDTARARKMGIRNRKAIAAYWKENNGDVYIRLFEKLLHKK